MMSFRAVVAGLVVAVASIGCSGPVNINDKHALWLAFQSDNADLVKRYLEAGLDPNSQIKEQSLLWYALEHERTKVATLLVDAGADCNGRYGKGINISRPMIFQALWTGQNRIVNLCLDKKADTSWRTTRGMGFFHHAVVGGDMALLERARAMGFSPLEKTNDGMNALHVLLSNGMYSKTRDKVGKVKQLVAWGVNPNESDSLGYLPIDYAARNNIYWKDNEAAAVTLISAGSSTKLKPYMSGTTEIKESLAKLAGYWALPNLTEALLIDAERTANVSEVCREIQSHINDRNDLEKERTQQTHDVLKSHRC